jgi:hypothetical protein
VKNIIHLFTKTDNRFSKVPLCFDRRNMTSRGGLFIFSKFLDHIGLHRILEKDLSLSIRKNGKQTKEPIIGRLYSLILSITAGCFRMYEIDELRDDPQFKTVKAGLFDVVSTTFSRTLKKFRRVHVYELTRTVGRIVKKLLMGMRMITMDLDSTVAPVYGNQEGADKGYNPKKRGLKSYHPLLAFVYEKGFLLNGILRCGSAYTSNGVIQFFHETVSRLPKCVRRIRLRCDCGFFDGRFIEYLEKHKKVIHYVIKVKMKNMVVLMKLGAIEEWKKIGENMYVGETRYRARSWKKARRIIVARKEEVFCDGYMFEHKGYMYSCYVTDLDWEPEKVVGFYNQRGGAENYIKDFKYGYGWGRMLTNSFIANEVVFLITMLAYNLTKFYQYALLGLNELDKTIIRLREQYIYQAAVITRSGGSYRIHFAKNSPLQEVNALLEAI